MNSVTTVRRLLALTVVALALPTQAGALTLPRAQVHVTLESNGVLDVLERVTVESQTSFVGSREISMLRGELFAAPSVVVDGRAYRVGDAQRPGTFRVTRGTRGVRIEWHEPAGNRVVRLGYRLAERPIVYRDVVDLRIAIWEKDWPVSLGSLTAALHLPRRAPARVRAWVHPDSLHARVATGRRTIQVRARGVHGEVDLRAVFPRAVLSSTMGARTVRGIGLPSILAGERAHKGGGTWWIWLLVALVAAGAAATGAAFRRGRSPRPSPR